MGQYCVKVPALAQAGTAAQEAQSLQLRIALHAQHAGGVSACIGGAALAWLP